MGTKHRFFKILLLSLGLIFLFACAQADEEYTESRAEDAGSAYRGDMPSEDNVPATPTPIPMPEFDAILNFGGGGAGGNTGYCDARSLEINTLDTDFNVYF